MNKMFESCEALSELNISNFNLSKVIDISDMFKGCTALTNLNIPDFNLDNIKNKKGIFSNCSDELKAEIKNKYKNINEEIFQ